MNKEEFKAKMIATGSYQIVAKTFRITCNAWETFDNGMVFPNTGHITYRVRASGTDYRTIYSSEETHLDQAASIVETLEGMMSLSDALFSWIDS